MNATEKLEDSRRKLLEIAAAEILEHGFQAASIGNILAKTGLSKGALYHHFPKKISLGYAVLEEVFIPQCIARWAPALSDPDPISSINKLLREELDNLTDEKIRLGCPINNLGQEMSPIDEGFRQRINKAITHWRTDLQEALERGQQAGTVASWVNTAQNATFFIATLEGAIGLAKNAQDRRLLDDCVAGLINHLEGLRS